MKKRVMIFDDDEAILEVLQLVLSNAGYEIEVSNTSNDVLADVSAFQPDIILMDHHIPAIGGIEATRLLREHGDFGRIPVLYVSASNNIEKYKETSGADDYIKKPFDIDHLEAKIANYLTT
ncbi:response regulator [Epilithonimonas arachidiradicis]|nr:response regulator [Epilithonimonas arachidiradicis]RKE80446.1 response regulator receiver domain-containing protein [Epilithonimonas arachidiradicis]